MIRAAADNSQNIRCKTNKNLLFFKSNIHEKETKRTNPNWQIRNRLGVCFLQALQVLQQDAVEAGWLVEVREVAGFGDQFEL